MKPATALRNDPNAKLNFRKPRATDGQHVNQLIGQCKPLDENSMYCNLLQCTHFADSCVIVERDGKILGFVSGYIVPGRPECLFIWQVAVSPDARGLGLGKRMIVNILGRDLCSDVSEIQTTITSSNAPSQGVFRSVARELDANIRRKVHFERDAHFDGAAASEILWQIGPFDNAGIDQAAA